MRAFFHAALVAAGLLVASPIASAQQQQQQHAQQHHPNANIVRFPMPAASYHLRIDRMLTMLRKARPVGPVSQGDLNKAILIIKDCAMRAEADGIVTQAEATGCRAQLTEFKRERFREIMATSSPADWARWKAALPHDPGDNQ